MRRFVVGTRGQRHDIALLTLDQRRCDDQPRSSVPDCGRTLNALPQLYLQPSTEGRFDRCRRYTSSIPTIRTRRSPAIREFARHVTQMNKDRCRTGEGRITVTDQVIWRRHFANYLQFAAAAYYLQVRPASDTSSERRTKLHSETDQIDPTQARGAALDPRDTGPVTWVVTLATGYLNQETDIETISATPRDRDGKDRGWIEARRIARCLGCRTGQRQLVAAPGEACRKRATY